VPGVYLDTICTVIDFDTVVMHPAIAFTLRAHSITPRPDGIRVSRPRPFLQAAAQAMGIERLNVIYTGLDPNTGPTQQWEDGNNALAIGRRLVVCHERNVETTARLEASGVEVIGVPGSELGSRRGGPRCMSCPVGRDPAAQPTADLAIGESGKPARALYRELAIVSAAECVTEPGPEPALAARPGLLRAPGLLPEPSCGPAADTEDAERGQAEDDDEQAEQHEDQHVDNQQHQHDHRHGGQEGQQESSHAHHTTAKLAAVAHHGPWGIRGRARSRAQTTGPRRGTD
jgi:Arginine deiminase